jgi:hypothetical protein
MIARAFGPVPCHRLGDADAWCVTHGAQFHLKADRCLKAIAGLNELSPLRDRLDSSRIKFPKTDGLFAALCEEVGELARALDGDGDPLDEALDVACVAMRIYTESDNTPASAEIYRKVMAHAKRLETFARIAQARLSQ